HPFFFQAEDGIRDFHVTGVQTCALPILLETVLVTNARAYQKPRLLKELRIIFGDGLLTADGEHWRFRRKLLQPVLTTKRNAGYRSEERRVGKESTACGTTQLVKIRPTAD